MSIADSTDWLPTPLAAIAPLDASLRCQICKDFFTTPMITSCSHTFCSLCIRRCLSQDGKCPACREPDQELRLRRNWVTEDLVTNFAKSRDQLLRFAREAAETEQAEEMEAQRPKKRRKVDGQKTTHLPERMSTRSQSQRTAPQPSQESRFSASDVIADSDGDGESDYEDEPSYPKHITKPEPQDGLVACPMLCGRRMKEQNVYSHLDICTGPSSEVVSSPPSNSHHFPTGSAAYTVPNATKQNDRLPTINYALLNENQLRKKMRELGIPNAGSKVLLQKRHTEWLNLWNANCDSLRPIPKSRLLSELDTWERTQGRQISNNAGPSGVMVKEFDRGAYAQSNRSDFDELIRKAREKRAVVKPQTTQTATSKDGDNRGHPKSGQEMLTPKSVLETSNVASQQEQHSSRAENGQGSSQRPRQPEMELTQSQSTRLDKIAV